MAKDETVLALQRKLQEKEEEYRRLKQSVNKRAKTSEQTAAHTVGKTETNKEEVSMAFSDRVLVCQSYCFYLLHSDFCCFCLQGKAWEESELGLEHYIQNGFL